MTPVIALTTPQGFSDQGCIGGGERYPFNIARGIARAAKGTLSVKLIVNGAPRQTFLLEDGVELEVIEPAAPWRDPFEAVSWDLPSALSTCQLVHVQQAFTRAGEAAVLAASQQRKRICITDLGAAKSSAGLALGLFDVADRQVAISDFAAASLPSSPEVTVVKGGVDTGYFSPGGGLPRRDCFLFVGRLLPHKGIDRLIAALPEELPLTVCGRSYRPDYLTRLQALAVDKSVTFVTDADDAQVLDLYRNAIATILPSVHRDLYGEWHAAPELMGLTLLESMACGTAAIASDVASMPEFIDPGHTGFIYTSLDDLTKTLTSLASDRELVQTMGEAARARTVEMYDIVPVGKRLVDLYTTLLAR